ncbi:MAG TPA: hypothetical protein VFE07_13315 [Marmoricola sp.]|jgi:hypothetical protein|nr:hypothetical protein [Marmoricola sp.]
MSVLINATPIGFLGQWAMRSQEQARRNAMAACTVLAARRLEREEVRAYIAEHIAGQLAARAAADVGEVALG